MDWRLGLQHKCSGVLDPLRGVGVGASPEISYANTFLTGMGELLLWQDFIGYLEDDCPKMRLISLYSSSLSLNHPYPLPVPAQHTHAPLKYVCRKAKQMPEFKMFSLPNYLKLSQAYKVVHVNHKTVIIIKKTNPQRTTTQLNNGVISLKLIEISFHHKHGAFSGFFFYCMFTLCKVILHPGTVPPACTPGTMGGRGRKGVG